MRPATKQYRRAVGRHLRGMLDTTILQRRRDTTYRMLAKKHDGQVPCYCCGRHVPKQHATLEHIIPKSRGGTDEMSNLSISHRYCNNKRGDAMPETGASQWAQP